MHDNKEIIGLVIYEKKGLERELREIDNLDYVLKVAKKLEQLLTKINTVESDSVRDEITRIIAKAKPLREDKLKVLKYEAYRKHGVYCRDKWYMSPQYIADTDLINDLAKENENNSHFTNFFYQFCEDTCYTFINKKELESHLLNENFYLMYSSIYSNPAISYHVLMNIHELMNDDFIDLYKVKQDHKKELFSVNDVDDVARITHLISANKFRDKLEFPVLLDTIYTDPSYTGLRKKDSRGQYINPKSEK